MTNQNTVTREASTRFDAVEGVEEVTGRLGQSVGLRVQYTEWLLQWGVTMAHRRQYAQRHWTMAAQQLVNMSSVPQTDYRGPSTVASLRAKPHSVNGLLVLSRLALFKFIVGSVILTVRSLCWSINRRWWTGKKYTFYEPS